LGKQPEAGYTVLMGRWRSVSVVHGELLGEPSPELRAKLADSDVPVLFTPYQSM